MRLLVCGSRALVPDADDYAALATFLLPGTTLIHGDARGADRFAADFAKGLGFVTVLPFPADWTDLSHPDAVIRRRADGSQYDAMAGMRRNQRMLDEGKPDAVLVLLRGAGKGTLDMVKRAKAAGLPIYGSPQPERRDTRTPIERMIDEACGVPR